MSMLSERVKWIVYSIIMLLCREGLKVRCKKDEAQSELAILIKLDQPLLDNLLLEVNRILSKIKGSRERNINELSKIAHITE